MSEEIKPKKDMTIPSLIKANSSYLEDYQVIEACQEYGISYDGVDADKMRLLMLLKGAEKLLT